MWGRKKYSNLARKLKSNMRKIYPIGIQTFEKIVQGNFRYVDKTQFVYDIAHKYQNVFLSRPRRFGKSLLASTFHSFFEGKKELFEGLEAGKLETEWTQYPVLHFDMSTAKHADVNKLHNVLDYQLMLAERKFGVARVSDDENLRLTNLINECSDKFGHDVVILIDEYDAPLLDVLGDNKALKANREVMRNFYSPLKACDKNIRFVFITGITKFSQLSIFSELNNLQNISMMPEYAGICGITSEELQTQFSDDIDDFASRMGIRREEAITKLKDFYDGYHFSHNSPDIYNPFSLIKALDAAEFDFYWFSSGTPTYLIEQMRKFKSTPQGISKIKARKSDFDAPTEGMTNITPLMYQSGYLTIKDYNPRSTLYTLAIPNREVRAGLMESIIPYIANAQYSTPASLLVGEMQEAFCDDDINKVMEDLKIFFSSLPYPDNAKKNPESFYQMLLFAIFSMMCQFVDVEVRTPQGRADLVLNAENKIYIIEVKIDKGADFALDQINLKDYGERFLIQGKPIVKVGVNFDSEDKRNITDWKIIG